MLKDNIFFKKINRKKYSFTITYVKVFLMNKQFVKFVTDFGPLLIFFTIYFKNDNDLKLALTPFIIATFISLGIVYFLEKKISLVPLLSGILIGFFGGLTLYFNNPVFYYIKPTVINLIFAIVLLIGKYFTEKPLLKIFFKNQLELQDEGWVILTNRWAFFFIFLAILNEIVWRTQTEVFWVNFKVWGLLFLTLLFTASTIPIISKYKIKNETS